MNNRQGNMFFHLLASAGFVILFGMMMTACANSEKGKVLKLAHTLNTDHPVHKAMEFLAKRTAELSAEKLKIEIYPSGQLGSEQQNVELLQLGSLAMTKVSAAVMEGFAEEYKALGLPYIFRDQAHYFQVCDGEIGQDLLASTANKWIKGLCFYNAGSRSFYTNDKPIRTPDDLKGLKIRVMNSQTAIKMVEALGGSPTPMSPGELFTALQSGVVDGAENNPPTYQSSHHYEISKYYSLDEHSSIPDVLLMSSVVWDKLSTDERKWLSQAVQESVILQRKLWNDAEIQALKIVKAAGSEIIYPDKSLFNAKVQVLYAQYKDNESLYGYITKIQNLK